MPILILLFCLVVISPKALADETTEVPFFNVFTSELPPQEVTRMEKEKIYYLSLALKGQKELTDDSEQYMEDPNFCKKFTGTEKYLNCAVGYAARRAMIEGHYALNLAKYLYMDNQLQKQKLWELQKKLNLYTEYLKDPKKAKYD